MAYEVAVNLVKERRSNHKTYWKVHGKHTPLKYGGTYGEAPPKPGWLVRDSDDSAEDVREDAAQPENMNPVKQEQEHAASQKKLHYDSDSVTDSEESSSVDTKVEKLFKTTIITEKGRVVDMTMPLRDRIRAAAGITTCKAPAAVESNKASTGVESNKESTGVESNKAPAPVESKESAGGESNKDPSAGIYCMDCSSELTPTTANPPVSSWTPDASIEVLKHKKNYFLHTKILFLEIKLLIIKT